ncbi:MAG: carbohydrate-binding domain-containing protein [Firmicutes bacterium]|nr:carbohydrate-binding domain-containing protein [Bacillota bacterium]
MTKKSALILITAAVAAYMLGSCAAPKVPDKNDASDSASSVSTGKETSGEISGEETKISEEIEISDEIINGIFETQTEKPDTEGAVTINLSDCTDKIEADGIKASAGLILINKGGSYIFSGKSDNVRIVVNAPKETVMLIFDGAEISCPDNCPVYIYKSEKTVLYLNENTVNTVSDGSQYSFSDDYSSAEEEEPNACIYSKSDLVIFGGGTLVVNASFKNGITGKDTLQIESSQIVVNSKNHGINGKDYLAAKDASISVNCGGDALRSTGNSEGTLGYIVLENCSLSFESGEDGIHANTWLKMSGGTCGITSGGGSGMKVGSDVSAKGIKAGGLISISSGIYQLNCSDDAVHSNESVLITGGEFEISSGDDGIHADKNVCVEAGTIVINKCYEGIEGSVIEISGGEISICSSDDGLNAAGGADQSGFGGKWNMFGGSSDSSDYYLKISGGRIFIDASGDGADSNGDFFVSGGELYISGPSSNGNGAIDYNGNAEISGGVVVAAGSSGMSQNFGNNSTQGSIMLNLGSNTSGEISLSESDGKVLVSFVPTRNYSNVVISCPELKIGGSYTVAAGSQTESITLSSLIYGGSSGMPGGGWQGGGSGRKPGGRL